MEVQFDKTRARLALVVTLVFLALEGAILIRSGLDRFLGILTSPAGLAYQVLFFLSMAVWTLRYVPPAVKALAAQDAAIRVLGSDLYFWGDDTPCGTALSYQSALTRKDLVAGDEGGKRRISTIFLQNSWRDTLKSAGVVVEQMPA